MTNPIEFQPSFSIHHPSEIEDYLRCPRLYFYSQVLGWKSDAPNNNLTFGKAWHAGQEYLLLFGYDKIAEAYDAFLEIYRAEFDESTDELFGAKTPAAAVMALIQYAQRYASDELQQKVLYTEISGSVGIAENRSIHFRMDSIIQNLSNGKIFSRDHKTKGGPFNRQWRDSFLLSFQGLTYSHALFCLYPTDSVLGVEFSGTSFEAKPRAAKDTGGIRISFERVPVWKTFDQMQVYLYNINRWIDSIELDFSLLSEADDSDEVLDCFPLNPTSCTDYFGCQFIDFCLSWPNPLRRCHLPPPGFKVEYYDPRSEESKHKMDLPFKRGE